MTNNVFVVSKIVFEKNLFTWLRMNTISLALGVAPKVG